MTKDKKCMRILDIFQILLKEEIIIKKQAAEIFNVNEKTIARDINDLNCYFAENKMKYGDRIIEYSHEKKGYILKKEEEELNMRSILILLKILLESRALCKDEMNGIVERLLKMVSANQKKQIIQILGSEKINYVELNHKKPLINNIWNISDSITHKKTLTITYRKTDGTLVKKDVKPASIMFSEYYFYLLAYYKNYRNPTIYRIDRIVEFEEKNERFELEQAKKIEEGELRKRTQFMFGGEIKRIVFEYYGSSLEAILDRLPTAEIIKQDDEKKVIKAEVLGDGIKMWILSQGKNIKVKEPESLVEQIKLELDGINKIYN